MSKPPPRSAEDRIAALPLWQGKPAIEPLVGGITNLNFLVKDQRRRAVVRLGEDILIHHVMRFNELAASRAAEAAGIAPAVLYAEPGVLVLDYIEGRTFAPADVRRHLARVIPLVRRCHDEIPRHLRGPVLTFWVFHVVRDYARTLTDGRSPHARELPNLLAIAAYLECAVGRIDLVFGHNDLLAANIIDDGRRLWLIDWDYAGFNSPLFDLGGLASNNELDDDQQRQLLESYFERPLDDALRRRFAAMTAASLLRETMWSMVSELHSHIDFDFAEYTATNQARFEAALAVFNALDR